MVGLFQESCKDFGLTGKQLTLVSCELIPVLDVGRLFAKFGVGLRTAGKWIS